MNAEQISANYGRLLATLPPGLKGKVKSMQAMAEGFASGWHEATPGEFPHNHAGDAETFARVYATVCALFWRCRVPSRPGVGLAWEQWRANRTLRDRQHGTAHDLECWQEGSVRR